MFPFGTPRMMSMPGVGSMMPQGPMPAMTGMGFGGIQPTAEMQKASLQIRKQQLTQQKAMAEQYIQAIDEQLAQTDEEIAKVGEEGTERQVAPPELSLAESQILNESLSLRYDQQWHRRMVDRYDMMSDRQQLFYGGMGDFGRPIF